MLPLRWLNNGEKTPFTDEPQYPRISLPKQIFLIFPLFSILCGKSRSGWRLLIRALCRNMQVICNKLVPVEQVVSGHHAQEACWIGDWVKLVVELLELLVQQISSLALCLAARTPSGREREMQTEREREGDGIRDMHWNVGKKKALQQSRQYTDLDCFSADKSAAHTLLICPKYTPTHTWPNFPGSVQHPDGKQS